MRDSLRRRTHQTTDPKPHPPFPFLATLLLAFSGIAWPADEALLEARAQASVPGIDPAVRAKAVQAAEKQILMDVLAGALGTPNLADLEPLLDNAASYIRSTQLVRCDVENDTTRVEIESYVKRRTLLKDAAGALLDGMADPPSVLLLVGQKIGAEGPVQVDAEGVARKALAKALTDAGLAVADDSPVLTHYSPQELANLVRGDDPDVGSFFSRQYFAEVTVLGTATAIPDPAAGSVNVLPMRGNVSLRLYRGVDGEMFEALSQEAVVHGADPEEGGRAALEDAALKLAEDVAFNVVLAAAGERLGHDIVIVTVEDPGDHARLDRLREALSAAAGVDAEELFFLDSLARLRLPYDGPLAHVVDAVADRVYEGRQLEVRKALQSRIILRFVQQTPE